MSKAKIVPGSWKWSALVPHLANLPCVLLNGKGDDYILAWGIRAALKAEAGQFNFDALDQFLADHSGQYVFGFLGYDVKNKIEPFLVSENPDRINFPDAHFFTAENILFRRNDETTYLGGLTVAELIRFFLGPVAGNPETAFAVKLVPTTSKEQYLSHLTAIKNEIQFGSIYEMNYCVNFSAAGTAIHPFQTYQKLCAATEAPFSCYFHLDGKYALCASPERYLEKTGTKLVSQPIKGTAARGASATEDEQRREALRIDPKERSENVMIVDLVRNDLSKIAAKNSVKVDELFGVYSFKTVHQLISSVSCALKPGVAFSDIIRATFPMGSMTGAPKISAMQLSEKHEDFRRGLYSGTIGYIKPNGDFDFNVVIRSILYNENSKVVSCSVGGAITISSEPEKEYEECLLKLDALKKSLC